MHPKEKNMFDIAEELAKLHELEGAAFITQLKRIVACGEFHPLEENMRVFTVGGEHGEDYVNLIAAARKVVELGYMVYILPNPKEKRTADYIVVRKGVYKLFELKTIQGKTTVSNRLAESIGQANRVLLNIISDYNPELLARNIKKYFERNRAALEVLILKGRKAISITRDTTTSGNYYQIFMKRCFKA